MNNIKQCEHGGIYCFKKSDHSMGIGICGVTGDVVVHCDQFLIISCNPTLGLEPVLASIGVVFILA